MRRKMFFFRLIVLLLTSVSFMFATDDRNQRASMSEIKAAFIEKISRFIEWPGTTVRNHIPGPFILGVIGKTSFKKQLESFFAAQTIKGKKVKIKDIDQIEEITGCHLLFISGSERYRLPVIIKFLEDKPVLTISDIRDFCSRGVHIAIYILRAELKFDLNGPALEMSGLKASYHLKRAALKLY